MSSSVFKVYSSSSSSSEEPIVSNKEGTSSAVASVDPTLDDHLKVDSNLVIVLGKDGSVHVDQKTLHSLLANETNDTSVSVVRITSPTPSIEEEIEEERRMLKEQKLEQGQESVSGPVENTDFNPELSNSGPGKAENLTSNTGTSSSSVGTRRSKPYVNKEDVMLDEGETPHVSLMVEGFYPPEEAKKFAAEVLTLAGLQKPLCVETAIDYDFQRYIIANDHCYTPLTSPSQKLPPRPYYEDLDSPIEKQSSETKNSGETSTLREEGSSATRKRTSSKVLHSTTISKTQRRKSILQKEDTTDAEELQNILEDTDSEYSEESSYPEEDDNESDLDFSITGRPSKKRKLKTKSITKSTPKKDDLHEIKESKKKLVRTPKKIEAKLITPVSMINKIGVPKTYGPKRDLIKQTELPALQTPATSIPVQIPQASPILFVKKDKKPIKSGHHTEALFSDMTSLFSSPDIIKKVGTGRVITQTITPITSTTTSPSIVPSTTLRGFVHLTPAGVKGNQKLPAQISIQTHTSVNEEHEKRLDLIDSIVQQEFDQQEHKIILQQNQPVGQTTLTEDIVKMLENNLPPGGVQEGVLPITDNSILAALGSNDDGLPEDLLQHVAELAENKELQEILDKQVLSVIGTENSIQASLSVQPSSSAASMNNTISVASTLNQPNPIPIKQLNPNPESLPTMTVKEQLMPRKEPIQIRRSDGRIITLPPIEAPATRSAKRRAQAGVVVGTVTPTPATSTGNIAPTSIQLSSGTQHHQSHHQHNPHHQHQSQHHLPSPSKLSKHMAKMTTGTTSYDDGSGSLLIDETRGKGNRSGASSRRTSESSSTSTGRSKRQGTVNVAPAAADDDVESDESWNSEDDPDRLWCICKQPHNNRFMICCDACEDWFHGKCVNITKAMGQQMEEEGIEWTCPNCLKKKQEKQQPKMTEFLVTSSSSSGISTFEASAAQAPQPKVIAITRCVVCGNSARINSAYCSDDCIRKHAGLANSSATTATSSGSPIVSSAPSIITYAAKDRYKERNVECTKKQDNVVLSATKAGPIIVMERKTGRCLTGKNAPTAENLKAWLASHPSFEVVPPGSPQAAIILAKQAEVRKQQLAKEAQKKAAMLSPVGGHSSGSPQNSKIQTQLKFSEQKKLTIIAPPNQAKLQPVVPSKVLVKITQKVPVSNPVLKHMPSIVTSTPKTIVSAVKASPSPTSSTPGSPSLTVSKQPKKLIEPKTPVKVIAVPAGENIRVTVKKTLKEHLLQRSAETLSGISPLSEQDIEKLAEEIEEEMFNLFNKDTGAKYRAKYRSLVFNIKDRKNLSLFQKICERRIEAKQLVRMTADELASQELAQWRENENKHQLEMIKKSELDMLACTKSYVLKTHKGEEVIEGKKDDRVRLDPTTSVEDVVAVLNNSTVSSTSEVDNTLSSSKGKEYEFSFGKYSTSSAYGSGPISSSSSVLPGSVPTASSSAATPAASTSFAKRKEPRRSRSRSRSRSHDRHRSRSRSKHRRRRSRSHERHGSKDKDREKERHRDHKSDHRKHDTKDSRDRDHKVVLDKSNEKESTLNASKDKDKNEALGKIVDIKKQFKKHETKPQGLENFNLVDQILASAGTSSSNTGDSDTPKHNTFSPDDLEKSNVEAATEQDQEPTSTVTIPTPPHSTNFGSESPTAEFTPGNVSDETRKKALFIHWTGNVHMIDVASVEMSIRSVSGDVEDITKDFSEDLDICGTIKPEIVWDYIGQIKKSPNKEVCLVRFHSNESAAYYTLYSHLYSRKRYSVIKSPSPSIKDFYIFPLPSAQMIPMILKPLRGVGIIEGDKKPDLLLGIIVKIKGRRSGVSGSGSSLSTKNLRRQTKPAASASSSTVSPSFALMQQVITKYASATRKPVHDTDSDEQAEDDKADNTSSTATDNSKKLSTANVQADSIPKKRRSESESPEQVDVDMEIIKAPITAKATPAKEPIASVVIDDDDDEPYSPGGVSDDSDNFADVTAIVETKDAESERIRLEMEEINRKIAEEKNEIVGIISKAELKEDEIKSTLPSSLITDIAIPSNLSEILASIKGSSTEQSKGEIEKDSVTASKQAAKEQEEYIPTAPSIYSAYKSGYNYGSSNPSLLTSQKGQGSVAVLVPQDSAGGTGTSKLAKLSEEELLSMVPDDSYLHPKPAHGLKQDSEELVPATKKTKWDANEPPPPGLEDEMDSD